MGFDGPASFWRPFSVPLPIFVTFHEFSHLSRPSELRFVINRAEPVCITQSFFSRSGQATLNGQCRRPLSARTWSVGFGLIKNEAVEITADRGVQVLLTFHKESEHFW